MATKERSTFPDFLGIGAQRAGTTWLYYMLQKHPRLWLPPIKELHYFDKMEKPDVMKKRRYGRHLRRRLKTYVRSPLSQDILWDFRYFTGVMSDEWYGRLFARAQSRGLLAGEITPAYAVLSDKIIEHIAKCNPDIKAIYLLRDPVGRCWSHIMKYYRGLGKIDAGRLSVEECLDFVNGEGCRARTAYAETIAKWRRHIPEKNLFIGFYDQVKEEPAQLLKDIFRFLSVDPDTYPDYGAQTGKRYNKASFGSAMPDPVTAFLIERYTDQVQTLRKYGRFPARWMDHYNSWSGRQKDMKGEAEHYA